MSDELCCGYSDKGHMKWCDEGRDRHPKWQRVEAGTVIPAGQPYRWEDDPPAMTQAAECVNDVDIEADPDSRWFIDSSWKPPLVLPTDLSVIRAVMSIGEPFLLTGPYPGDYWTDAENGIFRQADKYLTSFEVLWTEGK